MATKDITFRLSGISPTISKSELESDLKDLKPSSDPQYAGLEDALDTIRIRSLARKHRHSCATVTVTTSLSADELMKRLREAFQNSELEYSCDCDFRGLTPLYEDSDGDPICDVIAVPGLASHAIGSWKTPGSNDVWLRDWLPKSVPHIRVVIYGYDTSLLKNDSKASIGELGATFLNSLQTFRRNTASENRPIVFIGHSLGGLLIKEAFTASFNNATNQSMHECCNGFLFFGVPHLGLRHNTLQTIVDGQPNQALIRSIEVDKDSEPSEYLNRIRDDFARNIDSLGSKTKMVCFHETDESPTVEMCEGQLRKTGAKMRMVTQQSATETGVGGIVNRDVVALKGDHSSIVKFPSETDEGYLIVVDRIRDLVSGTRAKIARDDSQAKKVRQTTVNQAGSHFGGQTVTMSGGSFFQGNQSHVNEYR